MNFACPNCNLAGQIADERVPEQGLYATCPKCKSRFLVKLETFTPPVPIVTESAVVESIAQAEVVVASESVESPLPPQDEKLVKLPEKREASTVVKVISCLFIAVASFNILVDGFGCLALSTATKMTSGLTQTAVAAAETSYLGLWIAAQIIISAFVIVAAIQFIRLRAWARIVLEVVSWLSLAYVIGTGMMGVATLGNVTGKASPSIFGTAVLMMSVGTMVVFAVPLIVVIWYLRGETITKAVN